MGNLLFGLTYASALGSGLIAGLFFAFSTFVMSALARLPAEQGIAAMQSINVTVLNPLFSLVFMGTALACVILGIASLTKWGTASAAYVLAGCILYFVGSFLVTIIFNVPLNDALAAVAPGSSEGAQLWNLYLSKWVAWNHVRTIASLAALASFILAIRKW
ncbi:membrane protein [Paenibacillus tyrfis]|uniref:anthrone oxygenase family protein n=1 Tax=Paenibacillus tyrfis TaxID=1501230 RepID=UPI0024931C25|nr:anthrone oxygenase family protein [Paenibacillus tyrfis]GLI04558.1 membrane protein [Paenibacillus tyrfis]